MSFRRLRVKRCTVYVIRERLISNVCPKHQVQREPHLYSLDASMMGDRAGLTGSGGLTGMRLIQGGGISSPLLSSLSSSSSSCTVKKLQWKTNLISSMILAYRIFYKFKRWSKWSKRLKLASRWGIFACGFAKHRALSSEQKSSSLTLGTRQLG